MRYSGEGTQENPYIPEDFTGFLHCIAQADSYVKLASDIDAAADSDYEDILYEPVEFNCKKCYADSLKKIIGVTVSADNAIVTSGMEEYRQEISNIGFFNWSFKQSGNSGTSSVGALIKAEKNLSIAGCLFSAQSVGRNMSVLNNGSYTSTIYHCSFAIQYDGADSGRLIYGNNVDVRQCNFILDGGTFNFNSTPLFFPTTASAFRHVGIVIRNAIIAKAPNGTYSHNIFPNNSQSACNYFVVESNCQSTATGGEVKLYNNAGGLTLYSLNFTDEFSVWSVTESSVCKSLTAAQMQDADYLASIGFLP